MNRRNLMTAPLSTEMAFVNPYKTAKSSEKQKNRTFFEKKTNYVMLYEKKVLFLLSIL